MTSDFPDSPREVQPRRGWILYDGDCGICKAWVERVRGTLTKRGFDFTPLQTPWVMKQLGLKKDNLLEEMKVLTPSGEVIGGGNATVHLARFVWWWWPFYLLNFLPGAQSVTNLCYRWFARHRTWFGSVCRVEPKKKSKD